MCAALLTVSGLRLERGGRVLLDNFAVQVGAGELLWVEGDNGAGKTTLLRSLAGLSHLGQEGSIERHCSQLLYLGHRPGIKQLLTAGENLAWFCSACGADSHRIGPALEAVGLCGCEDVQCQNLSAGQQRRVGLARIYLSEAPLWLLDEPFTGIDRAGVRTLAAFFERRCAEGTAIVMASHQDMPLDMPLRRVSLS